MKNEYLEGGKIVNAHGVRGLVKVESWCNSSSVLAKMKRVFFKKGGSYEERKVLTGSVMGELALLNVEGIATREEAAALKGVVLYLKREDIPLKPGEYFIADLTDLPVYHVDTGEKLGTVVSVSDAVSSRIYTIATDTGEVLIPDVPEFVKEVDTDRGVFIRPIPGFFD